MHEGRQGGAPSQTEVMWLAGLASWVADHQPTAAALCMLRVMDRIGQALRRDEGESGTEGCSDTSSDFDDFEERRADGQRGGGWQRTIMRWVMQS